MQNYFLLVAFLFAGLNWLAVARRWKPLEYITKPGTMVFLLLWLGKISSLPPFGTNSLTDTHLTWFALGLIFSLAGDVFLMLPRERFIAGLFSFLLAHLTYILGLNPTPPPINLANLIVVLLVGLTTLKIYSRLRVGIERKASSGMASPVLVYSIVISLMLMSALFTFVRTDWTPLPAYLVSGGALLFFLSDTLIAWNRFVSPLKNRDLKVMTTYHIGQFGLILGAALHFTGQAVF